MCTCGHMYTGAHRGQRIQGAGSWICSGCEPPEGGYWAPHWGSLEEHTHSGCWAISPASPLPAVLKVIALILEKKYLKEKEKADF